MNSTNVDPRHYAAAARSILSCAAKVELEIEGAPVDLSSTEHLSLLDLGGTPGLLCTPGQSIAQAGQGRRHATLRIDNELAPATVTELAALLAAAHTSSVASEPDLATWRSLALRGELRSVGVETCECCSKPRERLLLDLSEVELSDFAGVVHRVPVTQFRSPAHALNPGYLHRSSEHLSQAHGAELRAAAAALTHASPALVVGAQVLDLTPWGMTLEWVDLIGGHQHPIWFPRVATTPADLAVLLRASLHPEIC